MIAKVESGTDSVTTTLTLLSGFVISETDGDEAVVNLMTPSTVVTTETPGTPTEEDPTPDPVISEETVPGAVVARISLAAGETHSLSLDHPIDIGGPLEVDVEDGDVSWSVYGR